MTAQIRYSVKYCGLFLWKKLKVWWRVNFVKVICRNSFVLIKKIERDRPATTIFFLFQFFIQKRQLYFFSFSNHGDFINLLISISRLTWTLHCPNWMQNPFHGSWIHGWRWFHLMKSIISFFIKLCSIYLYRCWVRFRLNI